MSLTLEVAPAALRALKRKARRRGVAVEIYAARVLEREAASREEIVEPAQTRGARPRLFGKYAAVGGTVEEFLREKHEETEREEARWIESRRGSTPVLPTQRLKDAA